MLRFLVRRGQGLAASLLQRKAVVDGSDAVVSRFRRFLLVVKTTNDVNGDRLAKARLEDDDGWFGQLYGGAMTLDNRSKPPFQIFDEYSTNRLYRDIKRTR